MVFTERGGWYWVPTGAGSIVRELVAVQCWFGQLEMV